MSTYLIGDIHGCYDELIALLDQIKFSPNKDILWLTGDLVARGPSSLKVLRYTKSLGEKVRIVLGNHDLRLLSIYTEINFNKKLYNNEFNDLFQASDIHELIYWLRSQPLLQIDETKKIVMTHAGITPQWDLNTAKKCAKSVEDILSSNIYLKIFNSLYGDTPDFWSPKLTGFSRLRFIINSLTRMRYCFPSGKLDLYHKDDIFDRNLPIKPWFNLPRKVQKEYSIVFGHWSYLEGKGTPKGIYALDTCCCWGKKLTCLRWEDQTYFTQSSFTSK